MVKGGYGNLNNSKANIYRVKIVIYRKETYI